MDQKLAEQTRVSINGKDVGNFNDFERKAKGFHPENEPPKPDRMKKGPNGPGLNDKGPWAKLPLEWRENMEAATDGDLRSESSKVAFAEIANQTVKAGDEDLAALKAQASEADEPYRAATKANKLKLSFLRSLLEARGQEPSAFDMGLQSRT
jgi:hypothetical protein